jgi:hypothetical protein
MSFHQKISSFTSHRYRMAIFAHVLSAELQRTSFGDPAGSRVEHVMWTEAQQSTGQLQSSLTEDWSDILLSISPQRTHYDLTRIIGFGAMLTEFSASYLCTEEKKQELVRLGALFNLIAALYDFYLDHPVVGEKLALDRATLLLALRNKQRPATDAKLIMPSATLRERVMMRLIQHYLQRLHALSAHDVQPQHARTFEKLILQMFDAQNATVQNNVIPAHLVMRKSALSIVALGFPVWMSGVTNSACTYFSHLRWMYQLGDFISWVDDFADFEQDRDAGLPNRLLSDSLYPYERAQRVAQLGREILTFRENLSIRDERSVLINKLFTKYIYNWLKS